MFTSQLMKDEFIINDDYRSEALAFPGGDIKYGLNLEMRGTGEYAYGAIAKPFPKELLIPRTEWEERIKEQQELKSRLSDLVDLAGLPYKDQDGTNYCWVYAPTHCAEIELVIQNQPMIILSPESVGCKIKDYRNVGGWGKEALEGILKWGLVPRANWPAWQLQRKYDSQANRTLALNYKVVEWFECRPRNLDEMVSMLLRGKPGAAGLNWWGHEVTYYEVVWIDGEVAIRARNSWKDYGKNGYFILQGSKMLADDLVFPATMMPTSVPELASTTSAGLHLVS